LVGSAELVFLQPGIFSMHGAHAKRNVFTWRWPFKGARLNVKNGFSSLCSDAQLGHFGVGMCIVVSSFSSA
jgi:hypothetical protein